MPAPWPRPEGALTDDAARPEYDARTAAALIGLGVFFDYCFYGQQPGLSVPVFVTVVASALWWAGERTAERAALLATAVLFSVWPALRASEPLIAADLIATTLLLALAAAGGVRATKVTMTQLINRTLEPVGAAFQVPAATLQPILSRGRLRTPRARRAIRAAVVVVPVLGLFALLLGTADQVFADLLLPDVRWDPATPFRHALMIAAGTMLAGTLVVASRRTRDERAATDDPEQAAPSEPRRTMAFAEWAGVLGGIVALFGLFVVVQITVLFGGRERVQVTSGLTYAEYARSGFFQLIAVAALTFAVIVVAWDRGRRQTARHERWFRGLVTAMVGLTAVILASALARLTLYERAFGFTLNRFAAYVVIFWIGAALLIALATIWGGWRERLAPTAVAAALVALLAVNVISPERFVAERNLERYRATGKLDVAYLAELGPDATPAIATLATGDDGATLPLRDSLCRRAPSAGWRSHSTARATALRLASAVCG